MWKESWAAATDTRNFQLEALIGGAYLCYVNIKRCGHLGSILITVTVIVLKPSVTAVSKQVSVTQCCNFPKVPHMQALSIYSTNIQIKSLPPFRPFFSCFVSLFSLFLSLSFVSVLLQSSLDQSWNEGFQFILLCQTGWENIKGVKWSHLTVAKICTLVSVRLLCGFLCFLNCGNSCCRFMVACVGKTLI